MDKEHLGSGIVVYSNVFNQNEDLIQALKSSENITWLNSMVGMGGEAKLRETSRKSKNANITQDGREVSNMISLRTKLAVAMIPMLRDYCDTFNASYYWIESLEFLKYDETDFFQEHNDLGQGLTRRISLVFYPNDDYVGGEIDFVNHGLKVKPKANQLIVFPSDYEYLHKVHEITEGIKFSVASFLR
jgi:Rps23 Pro-64 3,4-dihydroxylase Tpa1-like proline 4-hydroxylase